MLKQYPAIFHKEDGAYYSEFPDLDGCQTYADTLEDLFVNSSEALGLYLATLLEDNKSLPLATDLSEIRTDDGFTMLVDVEVDKYRRNTKSADVRYQKKV